MYYILNLFAYKLGYLVNIFSLTCHTDHQRTLFFAVWCSTQPTRADLYFSVGCRQIQDLEIPCVEVDPCGDAQAAAEGAVLGLHEYNELKQKKKPVVTAQLHGR